MAEFTEVSDKLSRICREHHKCADCPMNGIGYCSYSPETRTMDDIKNAESIVMRWAKEHPMLKYPTWGEWFESRGDLISGWSNAKSVTWLYDKFRIVMNKPIPADIAEKLGIEPKEANGDDK